MKVKSSEKYMLLTAKSNFDSFFREFADAFTDFENKNIVLDFSNIAIKEEEIQSLEEYAVIHVKNNQSFAVVAPNFDADAFEEELNVVPTLTEAEDIIDMDEMTRDLGF